MLAFTTEFICGLLISLFPHYKNYNQLCNINQRIDKMINKIEPGKKYRPSKIVGEKKYLKEEIETLWKDFTQLFDKKIMIFHSVKWLMRFVNYLERKELVPLLLKTSMNKKQILEEK